MNMENSYLIKKDQVDNNILLVASLKGEILAPVSKNAVWIKEGMIVSSEILRPVYSVNIKKSMRNKDLHHTIYFKDEKPNEDAIEEAVEYWAEHIDLDGSNYGFKLEWDDEPKLAYFEFLGNECKCFH